MAQVYNKLLLDVYEDGRKIVTAVQNDTQSRYLDIVLLDGSTPIDLTGHEVRIYGVKPEGGGEFFNNGEITDPTAGRCQFELTTQVLAKVGNVKAQIAIYYDNVQILTTREFTINVVKSLISDSAIESSNEYGAVVTLFQDVYDMREVITEMNDRLGEKDSDSTIEGNSDGLFSLANIAAKINRIMNYLVTQSTAGIVETVNAILGRIGTPDSVSDDTIMGKLNEIGTNASTILKPSNNLKAILVSAPISVASAKQTSGVIKLSEPFWIHKDGVIKIKTKLTLEKPAGESNSMTVFTPIVNTRVSNGNGGSPNIILNGYLGSPVGTYVGGNVDIFPLLATYYSTADTTGGTRVIERCLCVKKGDVIIPLGGVSSTNATEIISATVDLLEIYYDEVVE